MNCPLITIGLTSYNCESTIKNAIKSAISQSWENKEIIIVDDFSTDNSVEIIRSIDFKNIKHKLFFEPENKGLPSSLNKIIKNANGAFICFFDGDDVSLSKRISTQYKELINYKKFNNVEKVVCYASTIRDYKNGYKKINRAIGSKSNVPVGFDIIDFHFSKNLKKEVFYGSGTPTCSLFIEKNVFDYLGYYDQNLLRTEDCDLAIRLGEYGFHFIGCEEPLIKQFIFPAEYKDGFSNYKSEIQLFEKYPNYLNKKNLEFLKLWHLMKANYFSRNNILLFFNFINLSLNYPSKFFARLIRRGIPRLIHDLKIKYSFSSYPK